MGQDETQE